MTLTGRAVGGNVHEVALHAPDDVLEEAVDLVLFAFEHGESGDILVQKAPACTIQTQAEAVCELFGGNKEERS